MKALKQTVVNVSDLYLNYPNGGESDWFVFVQSDNNFYYWNGNEWSTMLYTTSADTIELGAYYVAGVIGGITGTFHVVNYVDYLGVSKRVIHHIETERVYYSNEALTQSVVNDTTSYENIPLLRYQKDPALTVAHLYLRYPNGGERGWYAMIDSENAFAYWETDTNEWLLQGGGGGGMNLVAGSNVSIDYTNPKSPVISATGEPQVQSDWNATVGKGMILNKPSLFSGSYTDLSDKPVIPAALPLVSGTTTKTVGGLIAGTNLSNKDAVYILNEMLYSELFPTSFTAPSLTYAFDPTNTATIQEVGSAYTFAATKTKSRGAQTPNYAGTDGEYRAGAYGADTDSAPAGWNSVIGLGANSWSFKSTHAAGIQAIGSKGTTMAVTSALVPVAYPALTSTEKTSNTLIITGVYPAYTKIGTAAQVKCTLQNHSTTLEVTLEYSATTQTVKIPYKIGTTVIWTLPTIIRQKDDNTGAWPPITYSSFAQTEETIGGVIYKVFTFTGITGARTLRFGTV